MEMLRELLNESKKDTVTVEAPKPRNKQLNDTLRGRKGGRMRDKRKDYNRQEEKLKQRSADE